MGLLLLLNNSSTSPVRILSYDNATGTVYGKAPAGETVTIYVDGVSNGTAVADGSGNWSYELVGVADGAHTLTAEADVTSPPFNIVYTAVPPDAVDDLAADSGGVLTWTAPAANDSPITDYVVQYKQSASPTWLTFSDGTSASTGATVTGLAGATEYNFRVAAVSAAGQGAWSNTATATTGGIPAWPTVAALVKARYDAILAANYTESSGVVSQWNDLTGNGFHATQSGAGKPTVGGVTINGLNTISFASASSQYLLTGGTGINYTYANGLTVFIVTTISNQSADCFAFGGQGGGTNHSVSMRITSAEIPQALDTGQAVLYGGTALTIGTPVILSVEVKDGFTCHLRKNGVSVGSGLVNASNNPSKPNLYIGAASNTPANFWNDSIAAICFIEGTVPSGTISTADYNAILQWYGDVYGISVTTI